jgi:hypothetical protein
MTAIVTEHTLGRSAISAELFGRLVSRIVKDEQVEQQFAERIMDQALAFLAVCGLNSGEPLSPSELVDIGWHTFILHTIDYAEFCQCIAGRFIHHVPTGSGNSVPQALTRTIEAIKVAGYSVDTDLWLNQRSGSCTGCHGGCHDDPPPPPDAR